MFCLTEEYIFVLAWFAKRQKIQVSMQWSSVKFWIPMWIICRGHKPLAAFFIQLCKRSAHKGSQEELPPLWRNMLISSFSSSSLLVKSVHSNSYRIIRNDSHVISLCLEMWWASAETVCTFVPKDLTCDLSYYHRLRVSGTLKHTSILMITYDVVNGSVIFMQTYKPTWLKLHSKMSVTEIFVDISHLTVIILS